MHLDTTFIFRQNGENWLINEEDSLESDAVNQYLASLTNTQIETFIDDFDASSTTLSKHQSLILYISDNEKPVLIDVYQDTLRELPFIMRSTHNPSTWFGSDSLGAYRQLFWNLESLLPMNNINEHTTGQKDVEKLRR